MRAHEIIKDYIDPQKIPRAMHDEIVGALERIGANPASPDFIRAMYFDEREELELEQLQLDLKQTRAEVERLEAEAARDRVAARRELATVEGDL